MVHEEDIEFLKHYGYEAQQAKLKKAASITDAPQTQKGNSVIESLFNTKSSDSK